MRSAFSRRFSVIYYPLRSRLAGREPHTEEDIGLGWVCCICELFHRIKSSIRITAAKQIREMHACCLLVLLALVSSCTGMGVTPATVNTERDDGAMCMFPFTYNNVEYNTCIAYQSAGDTKYWCSTAMGDFVSGSSDWGDCVARTDIETTAIQAADCEFPFDFDGSRYFACIKDADIFDGVYWCPTTTEFTVDQTTYEECVDTADDCVDYDFQFAESLNTLSYSGEFLDNVTTVDDCKRACVALSEADCAFFDFNYENNKCFIHDSGDGLAQNPNVAGDIRQYVRSTCEEATTPTIPPETTTTTQAPINTEEAIVTGDAIVTGAVTPTQPQTSADPCLDTFDKYDNTLAYGGEQYITEPLTAGNEIDECQTACRDSDRYCYAFDISIRNTPINCWFHYEEEYLISNNLFTSALRIDQYRRVPVCVSTTVTTVATTEPTVGEYCLSAGTLYLGGEDSGAQSLAYCKYLCDQDPDCIAIDYNTVNSKCYLHTETRYLVSSNQLDVATIDHYRKGECDTTCVTTWNDIPDQLSLGGSQMYDLMTIDVCKEACDADATCLALDFDSNAGIKCFFHYSVDTLNNIRTVTNSIIQSRIIRCPDVTSTTSTTSTSTTTTPPPGCESTPFGYTSLVGSLYQGAFNIGSKTLDECRDLCSKLNCPEASCYSFMYSTDSSNCYIHFDESYLTQSPITGVSSITHYTKDNKQCYTGCEECYTVSQGRRLGSGTVQPNDVNSITECQATCSAAYECNGFDFNELNSQCYIISSTYTTGNLITDTNYQNFLRNRCDAQTTPGSTPGSTSTTTTTTTPAPVTYTDCASDIVFLVDTSGSIQEAGSGNWALVKTFLKSIIDSTDVGPSAVRFSAITFSNYAEVVFDLDDYQTSTDLKAAIDTIPYIGGTTMTSNAIQTYLDEIFRNQERGNRPLVPDVLVMVTDGATTETDSSSLAAAIATLNTYPTSEIVRRLGVGVGSVSESEMQAFVTSPFDTNYVAVNNFNELNTLLGQVLVGVSCDGNDVSYDQVSGDKYALYVYRSTCTDSRMLPVRYTSEEVDPSNLFNLDNNVMTIPTSGNYWFSLSAGTGSGTAAYQQTNYYLTSNTGSPLLTVRRQATRQFGKDTMSTNGILNLAQNARVTVNSFYPLCSDSYRQVSLVSFPLSAVASTSKYFMTAQTQGTVSTVSMDTELPANANLNNGVYTCPETGYYVLAASVYSLQQRTINAKITVSSDTSSPFHLTRTHQYHIDGGDQLTRTALAYCTQGATISLTYDGDTRINGNSDYSTTFSGFRYSRLDQYTIAFELARNSQYTNNAGTQNLPFEQVVQQVGTINIDSTSSPTQVTCSVSGYYYLSLTVIAAPNQQVKAYIAKNGSNVGGIIRDMGTEGAQVPWHMYYEDTLSRSVLVLCNANDRLSVQIETGTGVNGRPSTQSTGVGTSFLGFLVYRT